MESIGHLNVQYYLGDWGNRFKYPDLLISTTNHSGAEDVSLARRRRNSQTAPLEEKRLFRMFPSEISTIYKVAPKAHHAVYD